MSNKEYEFTREKLYDLVWSEPMVKAAIRFGLSDVGLKKICRKNDIPVPGRGYWQRLEAGKYTRKPPLPEASTRETVILHSPTAAALAQRQEAQQRTRVELAIEELPENRVVVAGKLTRPHALTVATRKQLEKWQDQYGIARCAGQKLFRVRVSKSNIPRASRIMDALFKAFDKRGWKIREATYDRGDASVIIDGEKVEFTLDEPTHRRPHELTTQEKKDKERIGWSWAPRYDYYAGGKLTLKITSYYWGTGLRTAWKDRDGDLIETKLNEFMASMKLVASYRRKEAIRREEERRRREEYEAQQREIQRRTDAEAKAVGRLFKNAARWRQIQQIREYMDAIKAEATARGRSIEPGSDVGKWLTWAEAAVRTNDPLANTFQSDDWSLPN